MDTSDCRTVTGFAWDRAQPGEPLEVDIYVDYVWVVRVKADQFREDLQDRGMGDGRHAFTYAFESYVRDGRSHTIEARLVGTGRNLRGTPVVITCPQDEIEPPQPVP